MKPIAKALLDRFGGLAGLPHEAFMVIYLNTKNEVIESGIAPLPAEARVVTAPQPARRP